MKKEHISDALNMIFLSIDSLKHIPKALKGIMRNVFWRSISFGRGSSTVLPHSVQIIVLTNGYMTIW